MQASAQTSLCTLYTDTRAHAHIRHMQPIVHSRPKASVMDATTVPHAHLFISLYLLGPTDNADPPTSPQMRPFPPKREAENIHAVSHVLLSQFFSSSIGELSGFNQSDARFVELDEQFPEHVERSVLDSEHSFVTVRRTARTRFAKVRPVKNELSSPNFFQVCRTPRTRFAKQMFVQLRTGSSATEELLRGV